MNADLYNFHTRVPSSSTTQSSTSSFGTSGNTNSTQFCHSWNAGNCRWPFGRCRFRRAVISAKRSIAVCHAPTRPRDLLVVPGPPLHRSPIAGGGNRCTQSPVHSSVNSVNSVSCSSSWANSSSAPVSSVPSNSCGLCPNPRSCSSSSSYDSSLESSSLTNGASHTHSSTPLVEVPSFVSEGVICPLHPLPWFLPSMQKNWQRSCMSNYPDQTNMAFVITGLRHGFHVGFNASLVSLRSAVGNMPSALLQLTVIDDYLRNELEKGRVAGPFITPPLPNLHVSRFGVIRRNRNRKDLTPLYPSSPDLSKQVPEAIELDVPVAASAADTTTTRPERLVRAPSRLDL